MTNILNSINELEVKCGGLKQTIVAHGSLISEMKQADAQKSVDMRGRIVLNPKDDPDPYGYHGLPLKYRLIMMGWPEGIH